MYLSLSIYKFSIKSIALFFVKTAFMQFKIPHKIKNEPATWVIAKLLNGFINIIILINISNIEESKSSSQLFSLIFFKRKDKSILFIAKYITQIPKKIVMTWLNTNGFKSVRIPRIMARIP